VIDVNWAFCGERPEPILESIKRWRTSCGEESWVALKHIKSLIEAARAKELPVIYTTGERRPDNWDAGSWRWKSASGDEASGTAHSDIDGNEIVTMIAPGPKDIVIKKQKPSGFFGTNLTSYLTLLGCDSVIVVGTTTSGCVRATVVDAFSLNYRVILAEEGCFDPRLPHRSTAAPQEDDDVSQATGPLGCSPPNPVPAQATTKPSIVSKMGATRIAVAFQAQTFGWPFLLAFWSSKRG